MLTSAGSLRHRLAFDRRALKLPLKCMNFCIDDIHPRFDFFQDCIRTLTQGNPLRMRAFFHVHARLINEVLKLSPNTFGNKNGFNRRVRLETQMIDFSQRHHKACKITAEWPKEFDLPVFVACQVSNRFSFAVNATHKLEGSVVKGEAATKFGLGGSRLLQIVLTLHYPRGRSDCCNGTNRLNPRCPFGRAFRRVCGERPNEHCSRKHGPGDAERSLNVFSHFHLLGDRSMRPPEFISARKVPVARIPKKRAMLYVGPMVRAVLRDARPKTQTRSQVKP